MHVIDGEPEYLRAPQAEMQRERNDAVHLEADRVDAHTRVGGAPFLVAPQPLVGLLARQLGPALIERGLQRA